MKHHLQYNFTTIEQSRKFLQLGLPADSADCVYQRRQNGMKFTMSNTPSIIPSTIALSWNENHIPCWSVGRLIEIFCYTHRDDGCDVFAVNFAAVKVGLIEESIKMYEENINDLDLSKLKNT